MQRGGGYDSRSSRNQGGYEDRRGNTGGFEDRRGHHGGGQSRGGFEVRREGGGYEDRRGSSRNDTSNHPKSSGSRDTRTSQPQAAASQYNGTSGHSRHREEHGHGGHSSGHQRPNDRDRRPGGSHGDRHPDPWSSWQTSKNSSDPASKRDRDRDRRESDGGAVRDRDRRDDRPVRDRREDERRQREDERERRHREEREREKERKRREDERRLEENRKAEERRLREIKLREEEIKREEERLRRMEEDAERRKAEDRERRHREERERERERERRHRREQEVRHRSRSPVRPSGSSSGRRTRGRSAERSSHRRRSSSSSRRSALDRLGPKVPVSSRLGAGKVSRKRRRPGSQERSSETREEDKDNMQITIEKNEDGTSRKVARDVDIDNFTVLDQVGEEDVEKPDSQEIEDNQEQTDKHDKPEEPVDLEKVVIKKRDKKDDRKSTDGKDLVIKKPSSLISILAKRKQQITGQTETVEMTDQERSEIRKRCKAKYSSVEKVTEKVISMALDLVQFDETKTCDLIDQILIEDQDESQDIQVVTEEESLQNSGDIPVKGMEVDLPAAPAVTVAEDVHDQLDFEAEEPDKTE